MADFSYLGNKWDANFGCFFLKKFVDSRLFFDPIASLVAVDNLKCLSKHFVEQAVSKTSENFELNSEDEELLESQWLTILGYEKAKDQVDSNIFSIKNVANLKVCLVNIGVYIMFKCSHRSNDLEFALDILSLTIEGVRACLGVEFIDDVESLLKIASHHIHPRINDENVYDFDAVPLEKLNSKFEHCCSSLFVYRVLYLYKTQKHDEILILLGSTKHEPIQFTDDQCESLSRVCLNVSLGMFNRQKFEECIIWLKFSHSLGKQKTRGSIRSYNCAEESLTLLSACYMNIDASKYFPQIIEILDYGDQTAVNLELALQALVIDGKDLTSIIYTFAQYLQLKYQEDPGYLSVRNATYQFFSFLEENNKDQILAELLSRVPWKENHDVEISNSEWPPAQHLKWVCARFFARRLINENQTEELFKLLCHVQNWKTDEHDAAAVYEFMSLAESVALRLINKEDKMEAGLQWYELIVQFANRHAIDSGVIWNMMRCLLQLPHEHGYPRAQNFSSMIPEFDSWSEVRPFCVRLQMALRARDFEKALKMTNELKIGTEVNDWNEVQRAMCRSALIAREQQLFEPMLNYLEGALEATKVSFMRAILLRLILRFQMEILRHSVNDGERKEKILNDLLSTISSACAVTQEEQDAFFIDIRIWFARTAWNLGRSANKQSAYFRHHLFKLSSQLFMLDPSWKKETEIATVKAIEAAFDFGPRHKRIAYVRILNSALDVANQFHLSNKDSTCNRLVNVMEFHALCELNNWPKVEQLFYTHLNGVAKDVKSEEDADFFLSLASIIIATRDAKSHEVVATEHGTDTFFKSKASPQQQTSLTRLAACSLKVAIDLTTSTGNLSPKIVLCCRWIVGVLFSGVQEPDALRRHFQLLDELVLWFRSDDFPFAEMRWVFSRIWNSVLLCSDQRLKRDTASWLVDRFKQSSHYPKLMKMFKPQFDHVSSSVN